MILRLEVRKMKNHANLRKHCGLYSKVMARSHQSLLHRQLARMHGMCLPESSSNGGTSPLLCGRFEKTAVECGWDILFVVRFQGYINVHK